MHAARKLSPNPAPNWPLVHVTAGDCVVLADPVRALSTVLGSCVAACVRDPATGIGGMNHFLLADGGAGLGGASLRYGVNAMEALLNQVASRAAVSRAALEIKVFGGANVNPHLPGIGHANATFVESFLGREGLAVLARDLRGTRPRKIVFHPASGRVLMRFADLAEARDLTASEQRFVQKVAKPVAPVDDDIELF